MCVYSGLGKTQNHFMRISDVQCASMCALKNTKSVDSKYNIYVSTVYKTMKKPFITIALTANY